MKALETIKKNNEKIKILSGLYKAILKSEISDKKELEISKTKAKIARQEMLHLLYSNHKKIKTIEK
ncbi:hypothetical protein GF327_03155 [Candidatus Woesearchaeota archaeon]|nr:hypothetical protein [Candidatus Woesearchaeota archaeon]